MSSRKVVLVTGCSKGGIGAALCKAFADNDCGVYASARRLESLASVPGQHIQLDVLNQESCTAVVERIIAEQGRIDILVNNAGMGGTGALLDADTESDEGAKKTFETNFWAPLRLSKLVVPHMAKRRSGLIINVGSIVGNIPTPWAGIYSASKAALHSATETLRMEVKALSINVLLIAPGAITSQFGNKQLESIKTPEDSLYKSVANRIIARANTSQDPSHTTPASQLAEGIASRALRSRPPSYWTAGGKALLFFILERLPRPLVWWLLRRNFGTDEVGR